MAGIQGCKCQGAGGWARDAGPALSRLCRGLQSFDTLELVAVGLQPLLEHRVSWGVCLMGRGKKVGFLQWRSLLGDTRFCPPGSAKTSLYVPCIMHAPMFLAPTLGKKISFVLIF